MKKQLSSTQQKELLHTLKNRFAENSKRHEGVDWNKVQKKLEANMEKLWSLYVMESTGGEPDVVVFSTDAQNKKAGIFIFCDCSAESPKGRRSLCYDLEAWQSRKENKPVGNAIDLATSMGIELLEEAEYRALQELGSFDLKTSSWVKTPEFIRKLGGAIFCDRRYDTVFLYHNGAESYYAARGFRGKLIV
ncbi:MAG: DUF4256 domain-containing protein [Chitinophagaceae bacterium]